MKTHNSATASPFFNRRIKDGETMPRRYCDDDMERGRRMRMIESIMDSKRLDEEVKEVWDV